MFMSARCTTSDYAVTTFQIGCYLWSAVWNQKAYGIWISEKAFQILDQSKFDVFWIVYIFLDSYGKLSIDGAMTTRRVIEGLRLMLFRKEYWGNASWQHVWVGRSRSPIRFSALENLGTHYNLNIQWLYKIIVKFLNFRWLSSQTHLQSLENLTQIMPVLGVVREAEALSSLPGLRLAASITINIIQVWLSSHLWYSYQYSFSFRSWGTMSLTCIGSAKMLLTTSPSSIRHARNWRAQNNSLEYNFGRPLILSLSMPLRYDIYIPIDVITPAAFLNPLKCSSENAWKGTPSGSWTVASPMAPRFRNTGISWLK